MTEDLRAQAESLLALEEATKPRYYVRPNRCKFGTTARGEPEPNGEWAVWDSTHPEDDCTWGYPWRDSKDGCERVARAWNERERLPGISDAEFRQRGPAVIRALLERVKKYGLCGLEEKPHELKPDACVGWLSYERVEQMDSRIASLEAEVELVLQKIGLVDGEPQYPSWWPTPDQVRVRVAERKEQR